jgi:polyisoprenyl-teichoic acid--peptidoglycan teichoic acid transferase
MRSHKAKSAIQTGRNLPSSKYKSYTPVESQEPPADELEPKSRGWRIFRRLLLSAIVLFFIFIIVLVVWDARNISSASQKMFGSGDIFSLINSSGLQTDNNGRVNMVIAGYSADDPGHAGAKLTDSIILLSMNPTSRTGYMLSVPRDLYVPIPGNGHAKINEAYSDGGMPLLVRAVENVTGMQIPYSSLVDYAATRGIVNALGGINVTINSPDGRLYDPSIDYSTGGALVDLSNGQHHLDGQQALDFSRARGDNRESIGFEQSDFQRTADQRLILSAIKSKINWKLILDPRKNSQILNAVADNVRTNLSASEARPMFGLFNRIPNKQMQSYSLRDLNGHNYLASTYYEGSTLTPSAGFDDFSQIKASLSQLNL